MGHSKIFLVFVALTAIVCIEAASLGDELLTVYNDSVTQPESEVELERVKKEADAEALGLRHRKPQQVIHHHFHHLEESRPQQSSCNKCGGGGGGGATFAQSSAGAIHGAGSQSASQSASYSFGPFAASFSASQSNGNGGFYGFF